MARKGDKTSRFLTGMKWGAGVSLSVALLSIFFGAANKALAPPTG